MNEFMQLTVRKLAKHIDLFDALNEADREQVCLGWLRVFTGYSPGDGAFCVYQRRTEVSK
jgi:hypothetical protein